MQLHVIFLHRHLNIYQHIDESEKLLDLDDNDWGMLKAKNPTWNEVDLRDNRYDQIIHLITAANGAEQFYVLDNNICRTEGIEKAREMDEKCAKAWIGHPYFGNTKR